MIKELVVRKSGREGTVFESGETIAYSEMKGIYKKGETVLVFISEPNETETAANAAANPGEPVGEPTGKIAAANAEAAIEAETAAADADSAASEKNARCRAGISAKIYNYMKTTDRYKVGDTVRGLVYELKSEMGAFVAVDDCYHGMIPLNEMYKEIKVGNRIEARVTKITDGKLRLSVRKRAKDQLEDDVQVVLEALRKGGGTLYLSDETPPEIIRRKLNLSKKAFKRAVGRLLSTERIELNEDSVSLIK